MTIRIDSKGKHWWKNGKRHREDGPAIEWNTGTKTWYINGGRHRIDGPALEFADGWTAWFLNGQRHRADGRPAICAPDGSGKIWFINGIDVSSEVEKWYLDHNLDKNVPLDSDMMVLFKLRFV